MPDSKVLSLANNADDSDAGPQEDAEDLNDLDLERRRLMARNRAKLMALGIPLGLMELQDLVKKQTPAHAQPRPKKQRTEPAEPTRRSARLTASGGEGGDGSAGSEALLQLGDTGAPEKQHAATFRGGAAQLREEEEDGKADELSAEEIAARAVELSNRQAVKLRELELEGLVDFNRDGAVFVVIGSTGNHYSVRLSAAGRRCQCIDCRVRKRDCKHIKLILNKLQIEKTPSKWYEAVERCFLASSNAAAVTAAAPSASQREEAAPASSPIPPPASEKPDASQTPHPDGHTGASEPGPGVGVGAAGAEERGGRGRGKKGAAAAARAGGRLGSNAGRWRKRTAASGKRTEDASDIHEGATECADEKA